MASRPRYPVDSYEVGTYRRSQERTDRVVYLRCDKVFDTPKPVVVRTYSANRDRHDMEDIGLDFFAGSCHNCTSCLEIRIGRMVAIAASSWFNCPSQRR